MDLEPFETQLARVLRERSTAAPVADPVDRVRRGMRRRRRAQRLQVAGTGAAVLVLAVGASLVVGPRLHRAAVPVTSTPGPAPSSVAPVPRPPVPVPAGFRTTDLSFVSTSSAWALGSVPCRGRGCGVLAVTHDGGASWSRRTFPPAALADAGGGCASRPCVGHVRFVREADGREVGYAYGPDLAVTLDGGRTWTAQPVQGSVLGLEAGRDGVVRLVDPQGGCPCTSLLVQRAAVGSGDWQTVTTATSGRTVDSGAVVRERDRVAVLLRGHVAGGASDARSALLLSTDGGERWTTRDDPCGPASQTDEVDATAVAFGNEQQVDVLCRHRVGGSTDVRVSTDGGATFGPARAVPAPYSADLLAAPGGALVVATTEQFTGKGAYVGREVLLRSTDGGRQWAVVARQAPAGSPYGSAFLGFTTDRVGTWVGPDPSVYWRTTDGGASWTALHVR